MRRVLLPAEAKLRTLFHGPKSVGQVQIGERVLGYSYKHRRLQEMVIEDLQVCEAAMSARLIIPQLGFVDACQGTAVLEARTGECLISENPQILLGTCGVNPKQIIIRPISMIQPRSVKEAIWITWNEPDECYLWAEGLLVGTDSERHIDTAPV